MRFVALLLTMAAASAAGWALLGNRSAADPATRFRTVAVERGDVIVTVGATGTLEPQQVIDVGAQVVGRIQEFGLDPRGETDPKYKGKPVDYGTPVDEGTVLARIDPSVYKAQYGQAKGLLDRAVADLGQLEARAVQAEAEWKRAQRLQAYADNPQTSPTALAGGQPSALRNLAIQMQAISNSDFILAKANYETAKAAVGVGKATIEQQQAQLDLAQINLNYTVIKAPVKGTIIDRRVNIGQTVVASLNAPSLFLLAKDLREMEVWASVNEADIGRLSEGTKVNFTVDAFPEDQFQGFVKQVRLNASMTSNVVTYTVVITVDNSDMKLLPYLTADVKFEVARREGVLRVANSAIRYKPDPTMIAPGHEDALASAAKKAAPDSGEKKNTAVLWTVSPEGLVPTPVTTGASDGSFTEVSGEGVREGMQAVFAVADSGPVEEVVNPFAPPRPGGGGSGGKK